MDEDVAGNRIRIQQKAHDGETFVKLEDGTWTSIPVCEGFSQGCPASPVFAALVLNIILSKIYPELKSRADDRKANGDLGDDGLGSLAILMAYVDDVNVLVHHNDIEFFLDRFVQLANPLNAILNSDKTRILTSTNGSSLVQRLKSHHDLSNVIKGTVLEKTISKYSTNTIDGVSTPVECVDGLRILGTPIGSVSFCHDFVLRSLAKANDDVSKLLSNLDDSQTILRLYSTCTANKITHLFGCDVFNTPFDDLPNNFYLWDSEVTQKFNTMTTNLISELLNESTIPKYSQIISNLLS